MTYRRLKHLCQDAGQYGYNWPASDYVPEGDGLRLLRTTDLKPEGILPLSEGIFVPPPVPEEFLLRHNDILLSRSGTVGRSYLVTEAASGSTFAGFLVRFRPLQNVDARYVMYALSSTPIQEQIQAEAISSTIQNFNAERYANLAIWSPDLDGQRRIADFLDDQVGRLDRTITLQTQQRSRATERRRSFLAERLGVSAALLSVAEGTSASKNGWPTRKLGQVLTATIAGGTPSTGESAYWTDPPEGIPWLGITELRECDVTEPPPRHVTEQGLEAARLRTAPAGTVLFAMYASVGKTSIAASECVWNQAILGLVPSTALRAQFLLHWLELCRPVLPAIARSSTQDNLNAEQVRSLHLPLPDIEVQDTIGREVAAMDDGARRLDSMRERQVALLQERKQALITAAVTGQFDVTTARAVA